MSGRASSGEREDFVRQAFVDQARWCALLGSPFTARLMRSLERVLDRSTLTGRAVLDWEGVVDAKGDAVPLRVAGALHALARGGARSALSDAWPPNPVTEDASLDRVVRRTLADDDGTLHAWLAHAPQTNEIGRSAAVYAALMHVVGVHDMPVRLFELGASAGLNLLCDAYGYTLGECRLGRLDSSVQLVPDWTGDAPGGTEPVVVSRRGCDLSPIDVTDSAARERLLAYVWPDQTARLARLRSALDIARSDPPAVDAADAADWIESRLPAWGESGSTRVLFHTIARQYFPADVEARVARRIVECGDAATSETPFAHIAFEQDPRRGPALDVTVWPGGHPVRLAHSQGHGASFDWYGSDRKPSTGR